MQLPLRAASCQGACIDAATQRSLCGMVCETHVQQLVRPELGLLLQGHQGDGGGRQRLICEGWPDRRQVVCANRHKAALPAQVLVQLVLQEPCTGFRAPAWRWQHSRWCGARPWGACHAQSSAGEHLQVDERFVACGVKGDTSQHSRHNKGAHQRSLRFDLDITCDAMTIRAARSGRKLRGTRVRHPTQSHAACCEDYMLCLFRTGC